METEEIYNLSISPLVAYKFAAEWSQDNHISILTEKGVNIFELVPSPMSPHSNIKFSRSFIYAPQIFPMEALSKKVEPKIWSMQREDLYSFIMDESLTPKISNVKEMVPKIIYLEWSPKGLIQPNKCLLGILTSAGAIVIAYKISTDWYPAHDLSSIRNNSMESEIEKRLKDCKRSTGNSIILRNCMHMLKPSCFTWSNLFGAFAYIAVAYHNGDIVVYKIAKILDYGKIGSPEVVGTIRLNENVKINILSWIAIQSNEHLIIIGYFDGRIHGLKVKEGDQGFKLISSEKYYDHYDRIAVSAVRIFPRIDQNIRVLIAKGTFLFFFKFAMDGTLENMQHLQLEGFAISGMTCISADCALLTTENSLMFSINVGNDRLLIEKISNKSSQVQARYLGLACSQSSVIFINVTSPSTIYDHLTLKEPSKIYMFGLKDKRWDPSSVLEQKKCEEFEQLWDCIEVIRMRATRASNPASILPNVPSNLESLSVHELRIVMWISVIMEICEKKKVIQGVGSIAGEISEAQPMIFLHTACNYLLYLQGKSSLLMEEKVSVRSLRMYLQSYLAGKENMEASLLHKRVRDVLNKTSKLDSADIETCNLCGEAISDPSWKAVQCPQGHLLPRCAITLLQITTIQYRTCPICSLIFHSCLDKEFQETRCLFCDIPALQEIRILDSRQYIPREKTLSKPQGHISEAVDERDIEAGVDES